MDATVDELVVTGAAQERQREPVRSRPRTTVGPVRVRFYSDEWVTNVRRQVAWRASCSCGWRSGSRSKWEQAVSDAREHKAEHE